MAVPNLLSLSGRLRNVGDARAPLYRDGPFKTKAKEQPEKEAKEPEPSTEKYVPPHRRTEAKEATKSEPSTGRYVPPHKRARQEVPASSSARDPAYGVTSAARSVLLQKALDNMTADDPAGENTEAELQELGAVIKNLKEEQTATRRGTKAGHSSRQERDKPRWEAVWPTSRRGLARELRSTV